MSTCTLIVGEPGTGKSTSVRNLNHEETFIINVLGKNLPFPGHRKKYTPLSSDGKTGNYYCTDDHSKIVRVIKLVNSTRPEIKNLIIDDFQYVLANEFMRRGLEKGFDKYTEIGVHAWLVIKELRSCKDDLLCFILSHSEIDDHGKKKCKTIGKLLDKHITIEGMFDVILHTQIIDKQYKFLNQNDGTCMARSSMNMFDEEIIDNDLSLIIPLINTYLDGEK